MGILNSNSSGSFEDFFFANQSRYLVWREETYSWIWALNNNDSRIQLKLLYKGKAKVKQGQKVVHKNVS